jgi:hypothetical protein
MLFELQLKTTKQQRSTACLDVTTGTCTACQLTHDTISKVQDCMQHTSSWRPHNLLADHALFICVMV